MRARKRNERGGGHNKRTTTQEKQQPRSKTQTNRTKGTNRTKQNKKGEAGKAKEDRGGEGRTYRIRVAIVQLSGDQWGTRIIIMMNTSVW